MVPSLAGPQCAEDPQTLRALNSVSFPPRVLCIVNHRLLGLTCVDAPGIADTAENADAAGSADTSGSAGAADCADTAGSADTAENADTPDSADAAENLVRRIYARAVSLRRLPCDLRNESSQLPE